MHHVFFKKIREKVSLDHTAETNIRERLKTRTIKKGQHLLRSGHICPNVVLIESGVLRTYLINAKGNEQTIFFGVEGWTMGDLHSFLMREPARYNIDALEDGQLTLIGWTDYQTLIDTIPAFANYVRLLMTEAYVASQQRTADLIGLSLEQRYDNFVAIYPDLLRRIPQYMIATHLGVSPETLSRLRAKRKKEA